METRAVCQYFFFHRYFSAELGKFVQTDTPQPEDPPKAMIAACRKSGRSPGVHGQKTYRQGFHKKPHNISTEIGKIPLQGEEDQHHSIWQQVPTSDHDQGHGLLAARGQVLSLHGGALLWGASGRPCAQPPGSSSFSQQGERRREQTSHSWHRVCAASSILHWKEVI